MTVLAVDVGGTSSKLAVVDAAGRVVRFDRVPHTAGEVDLDDLARRLRRWRDEPDPAVEHDPGRTGVQALGFSVPGVVDGTRMRSVRDKAAALLDRDLAVWADVELGLPVVVENDARAACWGEFRSGAGQGVADLLTVSLGTGVGVGAVVGGRLLRGAHGQGGILAGHVPTGQGPTCTCGALGCVEARASGWAARRLGAEGEVPAGFVRAWALAIVGWCHVLDPARIVLTGGIASAATDFLPVLRELVVAGLWDPGRAPELAVADDVWTSAVRGVADLAREGTR